MFTFVSFSLLFGGSLSFPLFLSSPDVHHSSPLLQFSDQVRHSHLYTGNKHVTLFVEILSDGTISGSSNQTPHTLLELKAVKPGNTVIRGVMSSLYLCVNAAGQLIALSAFLEADCSFRELLLPDGYTHFLSEHHRLPVTLSIDDPSGGRTLSYSRFLPLRADLITEQEPVVPEPSSFRSEADLNSDDPLQLTNQNLRSPSFHIDQ